MPTTRFPERTQPAASRVPPRTTGYQTLQHWVPRQTARRMPEGYRGRLGHKPRAGAGKKAPESSRTRLLQGSRGNPRSELRGGSGTGAGRRSLGIHLPRLGAPRRRLEPGDASRVGLPDRPRLPFGAGRIAPGPRPSQPVAEQEKGSRESAASSPRQREGAGRGPSLVPWIPHHSPPDSKFRAVSPHFLVRSINGSVNPGGSR